MTYPLAVALLELAHLRGLLHPEVDLVAVLANHLQLNVLSVVSSHLDGGNICERNSVVGEV